MKAFIAAMVAMCLISVGAYYYLGTLGFSSSEAFKTDSVRLGN